MGSQPDSGLGWSHLKGSTGLVVQGGFVTCRSGASFEMLEEPGAPPLHAASPRGQLVFPYGREDSCLSYRVSVPRSLGRSDKVS